ncbi:DUF3892 domain-containing protein [Pseudoduganella eburnea]|uniref:DUF3892 domain-containing protein n=1 Tax=Massilia eburnea TaxID=1776165 RepID=A0A6L6QNI0_9BURK|nr:DUF3892 domain-containing protein [Massilia eburnea]MTW13427.1 DUF3892 domain-containing protein [Massilia eburnea]
MADCQINCINLSNSGRNHEHITHVGNGRSWRITREDAIHRIKAGIDTFYVVDIYGRRANVGVVDASPPYLRTYADGVWTDNLLAQTTCQLY